MKVAEGAGDAAPRVRRLFPLLLVAIPLAALAGLELGARALGIRDRADASVAAGAALQGRLFAPDLLLMRPGLNLDASSVQPGCRGRIVTNRLGMRMREIDERKPRATLRVACLGDSVTFGWCVDEEESYPRRLEARLAARLDAPVEVLNLGVPGAPSTKGVFVARRLLPALAPDVVVIAYGFNDSAFVRYAEASAHGVTRARQLLRRSSLYGALLGVFYRLHARPTASLPDRVCPPGQLRYNLHLMVEACRAIGAPVVLADLDIPNYYARDVYDVVARNQGLPVVHGRDLVDPPGAGGEVPAGLRPPGHEPQAPHEVVVRARPTRIVGAPSLVGEQPPLSMEPGRLRLHDDGRDGDERAGDGVYSRRVAMAGASLDYALVPGYSAGGWGAREVAGAPAPASFLVYDRVAQPSGRTWTRIQELEQVPYADLCVPGDPVHLNPRGLERVAGAVADLVEPLLVAVGSGEE